MPGSRSVFECLILGDSIGLGTARAINAKYAPQCDVLAAERVHAHQILGWRFPTKKYGACVSIGVQTGPPIGAQKGPPFTMAQG